jgi:hypothetical protein
MQAQFARQLEGGMLQLHITLTGQCDEFTYKDALRTIDSELRSGEVYRAVVDLRSLVFDEENGRDCNQISGVVYVASRVAEMVQVLDTSRTRADRMLKLGLSAK